MSYDGWHKTISICNRLPNDKKISYETNIKAVESDWVGVPMTKNWRKITKIMVNYIMLKINKFNVTATTDERAQIQIIYSPRNSTNWHIRQYIFILFSSFSQTFAIVQCNIVLLFTKPLANWVYVWSFHVFTLAR